MWELLAPAGSYESILAAVNAGADAVYAGGRLFGARAYADNPEEEQLIRGIEYCHLHGRKLYLTVNTLLKEAELEDILYSYLLPYYENGVDGLIVQDFGVLCLVQECFPGLPVHASTQMTVTGPEGARFLKEQGASRVVTARELSIEEIRAIIEETGVEVETFIHGAMCYSYSGKCLFSSLLGGRSGNRGRCAQPCRLPYRVSGSQDGPAFLLSMKDMCTLDILPELLDAGIASLKIEGRMKRPEYTAGVVSVYRKYIDLYRESGRNQYHVEDEDRNALLDLYNRGGFSEGYYHTHNGRSMLSLYRPNHQGTAAVRVSSGKNRKPKYTALEALARGDVIELAPGQETTLKEAARKGDAVRIREAVIRSPGNHVLFRTKNAVLLEQIKEKYLDGELQEKVSGELLIPADGPAVLKLACRDIQAECSLAIAEPARSLPTDAETVRRQMQKTGNTSFVFEKLDLSLADGLFVPVAKLNELRRAGLAQLRSELLAAGRRAAGTEKKASPQKNEGEKAEGRTGSFRLNVLVTTEAQLDALLDYKDIEVDTVYLDSLIFGLPQDHGRDSENGLFAAAAQEAKQAWKNHASWLVGRVKRRGWNCFLNCPGILRSRERAFFTEAVVQELMRGMDGFLLHTVDELAFFLTFLRENGLSAVLAADSDLYAYNRRAAAFLRRQGVERFTLSAELNFRELLSLNTERAELNIYGYQALMQSAQCVAKNTGRCTGIPGITYLTDRKKARFPVLNRCLFCSNTVYNSVPLLLCGCRSEIRRLSPEYLRLSFTVESGEETARMLRVCGDILKENELPGDMSADRTTRGHFRRGVE